MTTRLLRLAMAVLLAGPALTAGPRAPLAATCAGAAGAAHHVAVVIQHSGTSGGGVVRACVGFDGSSITGEDALNALKPGITSAAQTYGTLGDAICQVDKEPAAYPPNCLQANVPYWSVFRATNGGGWQTTSLGVSRETYVDGDSEGFDFVGTSDDRPMPPPGGCPAPTAPPATPPPSAPATPSASAPPGRTASATVRPLRSAPVVAGGAPGATGSPASTPGADPSGAAGASAAPPTVAPLALAAGEIAGGPSEGAARVGVVVRSGPPVVAPTQFSGSASGWLAAGALVVAALGVLAWQTRGRRRPVG